MPEQAFAITIKPAEASQLEVLDTKEKGCTQIGLEVGSTDNPEAKRLYEHLGYVDWERGEFPISWEFIDKRGIQGTESEVVTSMHKRL